MITASYDCQISVLSLTLMDSDEQCCTCMVFLTYRYDTIHRNAAVASSDSLPIQYGTVVMVMGD